MFYSKNQTCV